MRPAARRRSAAAITPGRSPSTKWNRTTSAIEIPPIRRHRALPSQQRSEARLRKGRDSSRSTARPYARLGKRNLGHLPTGYGRTVVALFTTRFTGAGFSTRVCAPPAAGRSRSRLSFPLLAPHVHNEVVRVAPAEPDVFAHPALLDETTRAVGSNPPLVRGVDLQPHAAQVPEPERVV